MVSQQIKIPNWFVIPVKTETYYFQYLPSSRIPAEGKWQYIIRMSNLARNILNIMLGLNVQYLNHTDSFLSEQDDLISSYKNTKCLQNKKLQQKDTQITVQTRRI